jgi:hypothetical protein
MLSAILGWRMRLISSLNVFSIKNQRDDFLKYFENVDLNKMTNTQKLSPLLNLDNKDDLLIVGAYPKKSMATSKGILGEEMILSSISSFSINLLCINLQLQLCEHCNSLSGIKQLIIIIYWVLKKDFSTKTIGTGFL